MAQPVAITAITTQAILVDLDDDSRLDLVSVGGFGISVRPWQDGFPTATIRSLPDNAAGLAIADFDGDGRRDVATALQQQSTIVWLSGATDELHEAAVDAPPSILATGDVDGDGIADLVVVIQDRDELLLLLGGPQGLTIRQHLKLEDVSALAVVELNSDGRVEIAVAQPALGVVQILHSIDGLLKTGEVAWRSSFPTAVVANDLDDDGVSDIAAIDPITRHLFVGFGNGVSGWRERRVYALDLEPKTLLARRGPNGPELVIGGTDSHSLLLVDPRNGQTLVRAAMRDSSALLVAGDLDFDGIDELVADDSVLRDVMGDTVRPHGPPFGVSSDLLLFADLDGDGLEEIVVEEPDLAEIVAYTIVDDALREKIRVPAPPSLEGLREAKRIDGSSDIIWWSDHSLGLLTGPDLSIGLLHEQSDIDQIVPVQIGENADQDLAVLTCIPTYLRGDYHSECDLAFLSKDTNLTATAYKGLDITSVVVVQIDDDPLDDLWIVDADGTTVLRSSESWIPKRAGPLTGLTGAIATDLNGDGQPDLVGCHSTGILASFGFSDGSLASGQRLSDSSCTRIHSCPTDGPAGTLILDRGASGLISLNRGFELLHGDDGWTSGGGLYAGISVNNLLPRCKEGAMSLWTAGGEGLKLLDMMSGRALVEQFVAPSSSLPLLGDLDGDGLDELVADDPPRVAIARANGVGGISQAISLARPASTPPGQIVEVGEFDGLPGSELLATEIDANGETTYALWALSAGRFLRTASIPIPNFDVIADFDGDGRVELLSRADDWPAFARPGTDLQHLERSNFEGLGDLRAADMDDDGLTDLLASSSSENRSPLVLLRSDGLDFEAPRVLDIDVPRSLDTLGLGDIDHDGAVDVVFYDPSARAYTVCLRGSAGPAAKCATTLWADPGGYVVPLTVDDLDADGNPDAVMVNNFPEGPRLQLLRGNGTGRLDPIPPQPFVAGTLTRARLGGDDPIALIVATGVAYLITPEGP